MTEPMLDAEPAGLTAKQLDDYVRYSMLRALRSMGHPVDLSRLDLAEGGGDVDSTRKLPGGRGCSGAGGGLRGLSRRIIEELGVLPGRYWR